MNDIEMFIVKSSQFKTTSKTENESESDVENEKNRLTHNFAVAKLVSHQLTVVN